MPDLKILRLGHAGDGVAEDGSFIPFTAPGDMVRGDDILTRGPAHIDPACRHFGTCGGCALQHVEAQIYAGFKRDLVIQALAQRGLEAEVQETIAVPPNSRRRAALKVVKRNGETRLGFNIRQSHSIIDLQDCPVLTPGLFALTKKLREMFAKLLKEGEAMELHLTEAENGFDLSLRTNRPASPAFISQLAPHAEKLRLIRITRAGEPLIELARPELHFGKARVRLPPETFLQPVKQAEEFLQTKVLEILKGAKQLADLFCGTGTFALPLAAQSRVHAADADAAMVAALGEAARATPGLKPLTAEKRDLFRRPLTTAELAKYDALLLDPPRAGAEAQIRQIAPLKKGRLAYISCNPASFARDARLLVDAGWRLGTVTPVDQFLWSAHIELAARFDK